MRDGIKVSGVVHCRHYLSIHLALFLSDTLSVDYPTIPRELYGLYFYGVLWKSVARAI